jgi:Uma2 family endonuclease
MVNPARLVTADDLERMPEDDFRYELVRGRLVRMTPVGPRHGRVLSPDESPADVHDYLAAGSRVVVVLDPDHRRATVYQPHAAPLALTEHDMLDLDTVVPAFRVPLNEVFRGPQ